MGPDSIYVIMPLPSIAYGLFVANANPNDPIHREYLSQLSRIFTQGAVEMTSSRIQALQGFDPQVNYEPLALKALCSPQSLIQVKARLAQLIQRTSKISA
ncbi:MAG: hypothetical protein ACI9CF_001582 [Candidatus Omnitrophota bacterium]|jgi:hypothetical protein